jgi:hypothetical protein
MQKVKINSIKTNPKNPRLIKDDKFKKLVKSIKEFPQMLELRPIVVDENNIILGGNMRYKACIEAGLKEIFILKAEDLTEQQKNEFIVKDNVGFGEWDWDILANEWDTDKLQDWGLSTFGFEDNLSNNQDYGNLGQLSLLDNYLNSEIKRMFLVYDNETFVNVVKWFEQKQNEFSCEDNSQVILKIIENEKF